MALIRSALQDFALSNPFYATASVAAYTVDPVTMLRTTILAPLYTDPVGTAQAANPQVLDGEGKWLAPVYHDQPLVLVINAGGPEAHETGIVVPPGAWAGVWAPGMAYFPENVIRDGLAGSNTGNLYVCTRSHVSGTIFVDDLNAGAWTVYVDAQAILTAAISAITTPVVDEAILTASLANLPTTMPVSPGQLWWNGSLLATT